MHDIASGDIHEAITLEKHLIGKCPSIIDVHKIQSIKMEKNCLYPCYYYRIFPLVKFNFEGLCSIVV